MWTTPYHLNNAVFFIDISVNLMLSHNANAGKCTGIPQCLGFYGSENVACLQLQHELHYRHKHGTHKPYPHALQLKT